MENDENFFSQWCLANNLKNVKFNYFQFPETGRGMKASEDISKGEILISIPFELLISSETAFQSSELCTLFQTHRAFFEQDPVLVLCCFLLFETSKGLNSFWFPYFQTINSLSFDTLLYFSQYDLSETQNPLTFKEYTNQMNIVKEYYQQLKPIFDSQPLLFSEKNRTWESFLWAYSCLMTRCVFVDIEEVLKRRTPSKMFQKFSFKSKNVMVIPPYLDGLNHKDDAEVTTIFLYHFLD